MSTPQLARLLAVMAVFLQACTPSLFVNNSYTFPPKSSVHLAILPIGGSPNFTDTAFVKLFIDTTGAFSFTDPDAVRRSMYRDTSLFGLFNAVIAQNHSPEKLKADPTLRHILTQSQFDQLRTALFPATIVLVPIEFSVSSNLGQTFGRTRFRLYDLDTGQLIYDDPQTLSVNIPGPPGQRQLSAVLVAMAKSQFREQYMSRIRKASR